MISVLKLDPTNNATVSCRRLKIGQGGRWGYGTRVENRGRTIYAAVLRAASRTETKSEAQGLGDFVFVPWQIGTVI